MSFQGIRSHLCCAPSVAALRGKPLLPECSALVRTTQRRARCAPRVLVARLARSTGHLQSARLRRRVRAVAGHKERAQVVWQVRVS